jgi:hypothetical protein
MIAAPTQLAASGTNGGMPVGMGVAEVSQDDFLTAVFAGSAGGFIEFRALPSKARTFVRPGDLRAIEAFITDHSAENIFFGVATRRTQENGDLRNCASLSALWVDLDFKAMPEPEARDRLAELSLPPSVVVRSGGGVHTYWLLRQPADVGREEPRLRAILRALVRATNGDSNAAEPARVLRVPGTRNYKYDPPRMVTIETWAPERRYDLSDFDCLTPEPSASLRLERGRFALPEKISEGRRNGTLYRLARSMKGIRLSGEAIHAALTVENASRCEPPLPAREVADIACHAWEQADRSDFSRPHHADGGGEPGYSIRSPKGWVGKGTNFSPVTAARLLAQEPEPMTWIWEPYLPEGALVLLAAFMKVGKSTFAYALAVAIAQGRLFLGYPTKQGGVLILAVEEHGRDVRRRLERFGMWPEDPVHVHVGRLEPSPETLEALRAFISGNSIRVVILDTLARFWSVDDENDNAEVVRQASPLLDLARETGAVMLVVHHEGKGGGHDGRGIRGASALFALADQALLLERRQGGDSTHRVLRAIGRYDETPQELILELEGEQYRALGTAEEVDREAMKTKVLGALSEEPQDVRTLAEATELAQKAVRTALAALGHEVIKEGEGKKGAPYTYRRRS